MSNFFSKNRGGFIGTTRARTGMFTTSTVIKPPLLTTTLSATQPTTTNNYFGHSVAADGDYYIVGAYGTPGIGYSNSGMAYIYNSSGTLVHTLNNPNPYGTSATDNFAYSVAISGNYCIVGAYLEDDAGGLLDSGKAYIYDVTTGTLLWTLDNPNAYGSSASDNFGRSVGISGNYCIVGAYLEDDAGGLDSGKAYIFDVTTGTLLWTLDNPTAYSTSATDHFGRNVAISGNYCIVGAYQEDDASGSQSGKAYIFDVTTGGLLWTLDNPNPYGASLSDNFGWSVAISGNYCIVGAYLEDDADGLSSGKAYIFDVTTGGLLWTLNNPNPYSTSASDQFGYSVGISGNRCIVGAHLEDDAGGLSSGKAYIYDVTTGALLWTLNNPTAYGNSLNDSFGFNVAISGNRCIVGAYLEDDTNGPSSGKAYIFDVTTGGLLWTLNNPNLYKFQNFFGHSVAISGNRCIVGAYQEDDAGGSDSGKAYIFDVTTGQLLYTLNNPNPYSASANDYFGRSVAISGNYCIVGAYGEDDAGGSSSGKAYIFDVTTGTLLWTLDNPNAYGSSASDQFGWSVAISGNYCIVGAYLEDDVGNTSSGRAYIYDVTTGTLLWTLNNPNAYGSIGGDQFGYSVGISGNYCIVGANLEDDADGTSSGKAYIFDVTTGGLLWTLDNPNASGASASDNFGRSVAISGNYCIVGAYQEDDAGGLESGKAYIFDVTTGTLLWTLDNPNAYSTSASDNFGYSVGISGNYCIVGAYLEDDADGTSSGKAYIFDVTTGGLLWTLDNPNAYSTSASDYFGFNVDISGNRCIVGAYQEDDAGGSDSGKAYIFTNIA